MRLSEVIFGLLIRLLTYAYKRMTVGLTVRNPRKILSEESF